MQKHQSRGKIHRSRDITSATNWYCPLPVRSVELTIASTCALAARSLYPNFNERLTRASARRTWLPQVFLALHQGSYLCSRDLESSNLRKGLSRRIDNPIIQLVGFRLDNEDYAIAITKIQEIILMKPITRIPQVPDFIEGLINLRGSVIPIVNLRKRFGLPARPVDDETRTIVVNIHDKTVGCIVDAVTQVMRINRDQIQPPPLSVLAIAHQYIAGLARLEDRLLIILDIERLFDEQSSVVSGQWQKKGVEPQGSTHQEKHDRSISLTRLSDSNIPSDFDRRRRRTMRDEPRDPRSSDRPRATTGQRRASALVRRRRSKPNPSPPDQQQAPAGSRSKSEEESRHEQR